MKVSYFNSEGYKDPTAYQALKNVLKRKKGNKSGHISSKLKKRKDLEKQNYNLG